MLFPRRYIIENSTAEVSRPSLSTFEAANPGSAVAGKRQRDELGGRGRLARPPPPPRPRRRNEPRGGGGGQGGSPPGLSAGFCD